MEPTISTATNLPVVVFTVTEYQSLEIGRPVGDAVQVIPSSEYATLLEFVATATNLPVVVFTVIELHSAILGRPVDDSVHLIPSFEYADLLLFLLIPT